MGAGASTEHHECAKQNETTDNETKQEKIASLKSQIEALPDHATEQQVTDVVGDKYSKQLMRSFSIDGLINKEHAVKALSESVDNEVYNLFISYTNNHVMDEEGFLNLLRDCKILRREDLSSHYAKLMFKEEITRFDDSPTKINFAAFRNRLLPLVAEKKNLNIDQLMSKLAHYEETAHPELYAHVEAATTPTRIVADGTSPIQPTDENAKAAIRMQSMARRKTSQKKLHIKRTLSRAASVEVTGPPPQFGGFCNPSTGEPYTEAEITYIMSKSFETYITCSPTLVQFKGQMNRYQFVHLCFDAGLITPEFPLSMCQPVFDESIALASNPATGREYNQGIFYNKRLNFFVFRTIVFSTLATKTGISPDELFVKLTSGLPEKPTVFKEEKIQGDRRESHAKLFVDLNNMYDSPKDHAMKNDQGEVDIFE